MTTAGPDSPSHTRGHCQYAPDHIVSICGAPATEHLWVGAQHDDPDAFTTYTCGEHREAAHEVAGLLDWHKIGPDCVSGRGTVMWNFTGDPGTSFCFEPGDDPSLMLAASQPIGASS